MKKVLALIALATCLMTPSLPAATNQVAPRSTPKIHQVAQLPWEGAGAAASTRSTGTSSPHDPLSNAVDSAEPIQCSDRCCAACTQCANNNNYCDLCFNNCPAS